jgi:hypothetical protein
MVRRQKRKCLFLGRHFIPKNLKIYQDRLGANKGTVGRKQERRRFFSAGEVYDARLEPDHGTYTNEKTRPLRHFVLKSDDFTKTASRQIQGKHSKRTRF